MAGALEQLFFTITLLDKVSGPSKPLFWSGITGAKWVKPSRRCSAVNT